MILSKANLQTVQLASNDKGINILNHVRIEPDGSTVACDGKIFMLVSPVSEKFASKFPVVAVHDKHEDGFNIRAENLAEVLKNIQPDKTFGGVLEQVAVEHLRLGALEFITSNGVQQKKISCAYNQKPFIQYKEIAGKFLSRENPARIAVDRRRLLQLLTAMDKASNDQTEGSPVFLEEKDGEILLRTINPASGQVILGLIPSYDVPDEKWIGQTQWERKFSEPKSDQSPHADAPAPRKIQKWKRKK